MPTAGGTVLPDFAGRTEEGAVRPGMRRAEERQVPSGLRLRGKRTPRKRPALDRGTEQPRAASPLQTEPNIQTGAEGRRNAWKQNEIRNGRERETGSTSGQKWGKGQNRPRKEGHVTERPREDQLRGKFSRGDAGRKNPGS